MRDRLDHRVPVEHIVAVTTAGHEVGRAAWQREAEYEKAIAKLTEGRWPRSSRPTRSSRPCARRSARVIARNERAHQLHYAIKGGVAYVGLEPIPGARGGGKKKTDAFSDGVGARGSVTS